MTLVEVMVAMSLVAMVMGAAFAALRPAMLASENSRLNVTANEILLAEMERVRGMGWGEVIKLENEGPFQTSVTDPRISTAVFIQEHNNREDQLEVILEVNWLDASGKQQQARVVTLVTKYGISA
ncbi:PulJ/GspJ family protein [Cerasicoccus fimbriatus]|uniref:PulJ/GspJ family protein n=1 Tax=Cerasicoccus fimbriatus TaxID=3014554 RepID=UPI0022B3C6DC|nr:hypothetical protein [Cerasicoccus sp. TK19100]